MNHGQLFSPRTIGVCGSSRHLTPEASEFCRALGRRLAGDSLARIVSGGTKRRASADEEDYAADWLIVSAAEAALAPADVLDRLATVIRDDASSTQGFRIGAERRARGKTSEARRISFVRGLDALVAVAGGRGTNQELALAIEHDIPVLPAPAFGGAAREFWKAYRPDLLRTLRIDDERASKWEQPDLTVAGAIDALASDMIDALFNSLPRRCFVIMPYHQDFDGLFDFVIAPAIKAAGDLPVRLDRVGAPGDVKQQIEDGIRNCEYAIAVLDNLRANVLYELGLAHGRGKTTLLLNREGGLGDDGTVPFDLFTQHRLEYTALDAELPIRLRQLIQSLPPSRR